MKKLAQKIFFFPHLAADGKEEIIRQIVNRLPADCLPADGGVLDELRKREDCNTTTLGEGVFMPHARIVGQPCLTVAVATLDKPVAADTPDGRPLEIVCLLLIPEAEPMAALKIMSSFALAVQDRALREQVMRADNADAASGLLSMLYPDEQQTLTAADIMEPCRQFLEPGLSLKDATRKMTEWHRDIVPVVKDGRLIGEISCNELFKIGIPEFFTQLKSVGFIRHYDPFANYFRVEAEAGVVDVMRPAQVVSAPDATLIEIVFMMAVKKVGMIYVVDSNQCLLGIIDPSLLLARIVNI